jgi:periplasmic protein TonB
MILGVAVMLSIRASADVKVSETEAKQAAVEKPTPVISTTARQLKVSGRVELSVTIDPSGMVADVQIMSGNPILTASCVAAVKKWKFKPFQENGKAAAATTILTFDFKQ